MAQEVKHVVHLSEGPWFDSVTPWVHTGTAYLGIEAPAISEWGNIDLHYFEWSTDSYLH